MQMQTFQARHRFSRFLSEVWRFPSLFLCSNLVLVQPPHLKRQIVRRGNGPVKLFWHCKIHFAELSLNCSNLPICWNSRYAVYVLFIRWNKAMTNFAWFRWLPCLLHDSDSTFPASALACFGDDMCFLCLKPFIAGMITLICLFHRWRFHFLLTEFCYFFLLDLQPSVGASWNHCLFWFVFWDLLIFWFFF